MTLEWELVGESLKRPYRVPLRMVLLVSLVPLYIFIPAIWPPDTRYLPSLPLDRALPLLPSWSLIYGALYLFLILLPIFTIRDQELIVRTVNAYLLIWITAYIFFFVLYPTEAPRPEKFAGEGFAVWGLSALYGADPPYNCFPSLHVAHSFVSALSVFRLHRNLGALSLVFAALVAVSTLFTKQHYVVDVIGGIVLAAIAYAIFLRGSPRENAPELDRRAAPALAACIAGIVVAGLLCYWIFYKVMGETKFEFGP